MQINYYNSTPTNRMIAVIGCLLGGAVVLFLGMFGAFGGSETLPKHGYDIQTVPFYAVVVACGFLLLFRFPYAMPIALAAIVAEFVMYITVQLSTTPDVGFMIIFKVIVLVCCLQLAVKIVSFNDEDEVEEMPQPRRHVGPLPPQPKNAGRGQARPPAGRNQPPRPRR